ncbi:MAG: hypothetical protein COW00_00900 [Bdellovibrio sp. CG12_big_fil_rev_8_21_14_0_65_39_13]|nr:MAG: hypothetical protein COW78_20490 [Bdellovibrio sp. CG22_combo_CG10-13_8_21_14_all_39_27]PIQ62813.1 MAG: hypothetical protein COW00_00900 [Bdellovibrio sp. CG12_big_fil_rev_8_21_14_0_65_39_13]PIR32529.1 MAG: hypothetical protein COV37_19515 [Bdellovibrio sp. CG11_big_fil_rev_8_21_14_0_20_39_38]
MVSVLFSMVLLLFIFKGQGRLFLKFTKSKTITNPFLDVFLGIFFSSILGMLCSLFMPLNNFVFVFFIAIGFFGNIFDIGKINYKDFDISFSLFFFIGISLVSLILGYDHYPYNTDTDFYHANAVKWLSEYGTVIGLANLNQRLGVNTSWHILGGILDHYFWKDRTTWILPALSYTASLGFFTYEFFFGKAIWKKCFSLLILGWTFCNILTWGFPSLHYDFLPLVYNAIVVYLVLIFYSEKSEKPLSFFLMSFIFSTASFVLKPMGAMSILFVFYFIIFELNKMKVLNLKNLLIICSIPILSFVVWLSRNILISGWPFYPSPYFPLDLDWTAPFELANNTILDVVNWARRPLPDYPEASKHDFLFWFIPWVKINFVSIRFWIVGIIPFLFGSLFWALHFFRTKFTSGLFFFLWSIASFMFWFILAPDIRFGDGFFIVYMATALSFALPNFLIFLSEKKVTVLFYGIYFLFTSSIFFTLYTGKRGPVNFLRIGKHESGPIELTPIYEDGRKVLELWTPVSIQNCNDSKKRHICPGDKELYKEFALCSNSPLPCTGYFTDKLRLRVEGDMSKGFRIIKNQ